MKELRMPKLGITMEEGKLVRWIKSKGDEVTEGEAILEIEAEKATVELEAPVSGVLREIVVEEDQTVPVGALLGIITAADEEIGEVPGARGEAVQTEKPEGTELETVVSKKLGFAGEVTTGAIKASPAARRLAKEKGVDLSRLQGTGPGGRIVAEDVLQAAESVARPQGGVAIKEVRPLTAMRRVIAERMSQSKRAIPHFYVSVDADMTDVMKIRADWQERSAGPVPSINDFVLWACAQSLKEFALLNSAHSEQGLQVFSDINIGVAVAVQEGLVVPVIRNADRLPLSQLAQKSQQLLQKTQQGKLIPLDYEGGTFTVSNLGMFGVDSFTAIINPPQCAILAVGRVAPRVAPYDGGMAVRSMMTMTLSADHRIVDGVLTARFLQGVKGLLERPEI